jgi:hypothetical protein
MKLVMIALCAAVMLVGCSKEETKPENLIDSTLTKIDETQKAVSKEASATLEKAKTDAAEKKTEAEKKAE